MSGSTGEAAPAELLLRPTETRHRERARDDYVIAVHPAFARARGLKRFAVVNHRRADGRVLRVYGRVLPDERLDPGEIRLDQTLRNAIGIPFDLGGGQTYPLEVCPLKMGLRGTLLETVTRWLGRRYLFLRVAKLNPPDIEKNLCRVPLDALRLLGTAEGNRVVLVSCVPQGPGEPYVLRNTSIKAFELSDDMLAARAAQLEAKWSARYVDACALLGIRPDIAGVFLDAHIRDCLKLEQGDAIKVRRDFLDLFKAEAVEVGILFFVSLFAVVQVLPMPPSWSLLAMAFPISVVLSALFLLVRIRAKVK